MVTKKGEKDGEGSGKLYGEWQTERWVPQAAVDGKVLGIALVLAVCVSRARRVSPRRLVAPERPPRGLRLLVGV